jgi:serine kinase of HPr protein (carbohydrate metabolism regulator)
MCDATECTVHGTCIVLGDAGILIRGGPGAGKSDLALRLIDDGARLVSDDQVRLRRRGDAVIASAPGVIKGTIEVVGIGLTRLDDERIASEASLVLLVDLDGSGAPSKLRLAAGRGPGSIIRVP